MHEFLQIIIQTRREWLNGNNPTDEEWMTHQLEVAQKILDILNKGRTIITLTEGQISKLDFMLHIELEVWMDDFRTHDIKDEEFNECCERHLEMVNYLLHLLHTSKHK